MVSYGTANAARSSRMSNPMPKWAKAIISLAIMVLLVLALRFIRC